MTVFQILLLGVMGCLLTVSVAALVRGWIPRGAGLLWALLCVAGGLAAIWPDATTAVARALGIGRGKDLLLYCAIVVMMIGFLMVYVRLRRVRRDVTLLVRHIAIMEAKEYGEE
jgi:hypothetical protein